MWSDDVLRLMDAEDNLRVYIKKQFINTEKISFFEF